MSAAGAARRSEAPDRSETSGASGSAGGAGAAAPPAGPSEQALVTCHRALAVGSKSFALAGRLLPRLAADRAAVVYAWCRRADDAVDLVPPAAAPAAVAALEAELDQIYRGEPQADPALAAFQAVVLATSIPRAYPAELLAGLAMDAADTSYPTVDALLVYCHRVAGIVGLMMSHVLGVRDDAALRNAVHLGLAMQLTNICRDVAEDWERGRLYLPDDRLAAAGAPGLRGELGGALGPAHRAPVARVVAELLALADRLYASGERGLAALPWRAAVAIRAARAIYRRIGGELAARGHDPLRGRAVVARWRKIALAAAAVARELARLPALAVRRIRGVLPTPVPPRRIVEFPRDVLPL